MLHLTEIKCWEQTVIGLIKAVDTGVAHACRIKSVEGGVALSQKMFVDRYSLIKLTINKICIGKGSIYKNIRRVNSIVLQSHFKSLPGLVLFCIAMSEAGNHLTIHWEVLYELVSPIYIRVVVALFLIAIGKLAEGFMGERILWDSLQKLRGFAIICPLVVTVGQLHLNSAVYYRALFC